MVGMFGLNENNSQASNVPAAGSPPPAPSNPFSDNDEPAGAALPMPDLPHTPTPTPEPTPAAPATPAPAASSQPASSDDLLDLKQQALQNLQPLVDHLDHTPEEKFKTTMMLIQATDNSSLIKQAYATANQITDEKARAQALLDIVNEINYFTHKEGETENKV